MDLSLAENATVLTSDMVKKILQDLFARYEKAFAGWKASGNGKMDQGKEGETICLLTEGTGYKDTSFENDEVAIRYCDDDRYKFCDNNLATAYLWGYIELIGLTTFVNNNIEKFALSSNKQMPSAAASGVPKSNCKMRHDALESALVEQLPDVLEKAFKSLFEKDVSKKDLIQFKYLTGPRFLLDMVPFTIGYNTMLESNQTLT